MNPKLPVCCNPATFEAMACLAAQIESPKSLLPAAVALAMTPEPQRLAIATENLVDEMASEVALRVHGAQPQAVVAHLHEYLFEEMAFRGNSEDYYDPANSILPSVLQTRKGLPIVLSLVYKLIGERLGLRIWGVGLPGHFVAGIHLNGRTSWVDTFAGGRLLTADEARARVSTHFGNRIEWNDRLLEPVANRYWVTRILQNLLTSYSRREMYAELAAVLELELLLWPEEPRLQRDLAVVLARSGKADVASAWLEHYLALNPNDPQKADLRQMISGR
jgi:regulator of sirC expression with transglutaminase-like and TPR domain